MALFGNSLDILCSLWSISSFWGGGAIGWANFSVWGAIVHLEPPLTCRKGLKSTMSHEDDMKLARMKNVKKARVIY